MSIEICGTKGIHSVTTLLLVNLSYFLLAKEFVGAYFQNQNYFLNIFYFVKLYEKSSYFSL